MPCATLSNLMERADLDQRDRESPINPVVQQQATIAQLTGEGDGRTAVPPEPSVPHADRPSVLRWQASSGVPRPDDLLTGAAVLAALGALLLTPPPGATAAAGFAGLLRLALYALAGIVVGLTALRPRLDRSSVSLAPPPRAYRVLGGGVAICLLLVVATVGLLTRAMDDPLGPPLWGASMLAILAACLVPGSRSLGWTPLWPHSSEVVGPRTARLGLLVLGLLLAFTAATRLVGLGEIPRGINADEGDRAAYAFRILSGDAPRSWFGSGWYYISMVYFRILAASFLLFGQDVAGGRMLSGICGVGFVAATAWFGIRNFGWLAGLLAVAFASGIGLNLHHARMITEAMPTLLLWTLSIGAFLEGARTGRLYAWALAGLAGGLSLYFYPSARLWGVGATLTVLIFLLYQRDRRVVLGAGVAALATVAAAAPFLVNLASHSGEAALRYQQTSVFDPENQTRLTYLRPPEPLPSLLLLQAERTLGMFDRYPDNGGFYPSLRPIFGAPLAQLTLVGAVYALVRGWRDVRLAILAVWFWLGLVGVLATVETPNVLRAVGMLPSLSVLLALLLLDLVERALAWRPAPRGMLVGVVASVLAAAIIVPESASYFLTFRTLPEPWGSPNREGQTVATLGATGPVYSLEIQEHVIDQGWIRLLARGSLRGRIPNPGRELPVLAMPTVEPRRGWRPTLEPRDGQTVSVLLTPNANQTPYVPLLELLYPGGELRDVGDGRRAFQVSPEAFRETLGVTVRGPDGAMQRVERFGDWIDSPNPPGPGPLVWSAGVRLPRAGLYRFEAAGGGRVTLRLDGVLLAEAPGRVRADVQAAPGLHVLELTDDAPASGGLASLEITEPGGVPRRLDPRETYRLMQQPWGLLARVSRSGEVRSPDATGPFADAYLDAVIGMAMLDPEISVDAGPTAVTWTGSLLIARSGVYRMAFAADGPIRLELDGQHLDVPRVPPGDWHTMRTGAEIQLRAGEHPVRLTLDMRGGGRQVTRWNWAPPAADGTVDRATPWAIVPPTALRPAPSAEVVTPARP